MDRRTFVLNCATTLGLTSLLSVGNAEAGPVRRHRRRVRRRIRRRHRRRVAIRMIAGRPFWVVPVGLAIGWELLHDNHVVVIPMQTEASCGTPGSISIHLDVRKKDASEFLASRAERLANLVNGVKDERGAVAKVAIERGGINAENWAAPSYGPFHQIAIWIDLASRSFQPQPRWV